MFGIVSLRDVTFHAACNDRNNLILRNHLGVNSAINIRLYC